MFLPPMLPTITPLRTNPVWLLQGPSGSGGSLDPDAFGFPVVDPNNSQVYDNAVINLVGLVPEVKSGYNRTAQNVQIPQGALVPKHFKSWEYEWYVQDSWHLSSKPDHHCRVALQLAGTAV